MTSIASRRVREVPAKTDPAIPGTPRGSVAALRCVGIGKCLVPEGGPRWTRQPARKAQAAKPAGRPKLAGREGLNRGWLLGHRGASRSPGCWARPELPDGTVMDVVEQRGGVPVHTGSTGVT